MVRVRDLLHCVTYASVLIGYGAVFRYVHWCASLAFVILCFLALYLHRTRAFSLDRRLLNTVSVLVVLLSALRISPQLLLEPILDGLLLLVAIKLLEAEHVRDYMQIYALCVFLLLGSALISLSMTFVLFFVPLAFLLTASLILLAYDDAARQMRLPTEAVSKIVVQSLLICLLSVPILAVIFVILPRTNYPILMFLNQPSHVRSGFSDRVQLGGVAAIQEDSTAVFRAAMAEIEPAQLYWRGIVLDRFNGIDWHSSRGEGASESVTVRGKPIHQTIYLEPYGNDYLFGLDKPVRVRRRSAVRAGGLTYREKRAISRRIRYEVDSRISDRMGAGAVERGHYLQVPENLSPEIEALATRLSANQSPPDRIRTFLRFLRQGEFHYSLVDLPAAENPLRDFLFQHHQGNCEYFAASLAVLLRLSGIPSRLIGGYKGGYYNAAGGYYLVLQKHAHVWTEAYLDGIGWIRLDPTPYANLQPADLYLRNLLVRIRLLTDVLNYYWFKFIIDYDFQKQVRFINTVRAAIATSQWRSKPAKQLLLKGLLAGVAVAFVGLLVYAMVRLRRRDPMAELLARFRAKMLRHGYEMKPSDGLEEFVSTIETSELRQKALRFVLEVQDCTYGGKRFDQQHYRQLAEHLREF